ncbi:hypothetical protein BDA96_06G242900 [Sorghum bicolor]|jgi:speckle-type POZ protein|uniref:BTB domain-containing protein n=2 Tax=Sorghum bicolor TaxID=4558 RepID=A0A921QVY5_SORBI|nr:BTB/POZ and MATH domain-containing protein 2 [Sorghum bicolor]EES11455.1 hypothetical protein SORBI_3006G221700 [Sorghum bicolor]KAG0527556.1 hypothetical protein BDA96_06G242900 [Sorghum bicolor]|eukprot:XP_002447127.1 BTB/POZ and MATH domain-containing protein 2 [Sorghum bicolor]
MARVPADARGEPSKTSSWRVTERATATHDFVVIEYSKLKMLGVGQHVSSDAFRAGGHDWKVMFYPKLAQAEGRIADYCPPFFPGGASLHLCDADKDTELMVRFTLSVLHQDGRVSPMASRTRTEIFGAPPRQRHGFNRLVHGSMLTWRCIHNDALTIRCTLTVVGTRDPVPPPELAAHLARLLGNGMGADVTFQVGARSFPAHRIMLAARSPIFSAEFFGDMTEKDTPCIKIVDMRPEIFELLLRFIYTEALPGDGEGCDAATMQHLLVAADRYGLDRLKQICELKLHASVDAETVDSMLALAERHSCPRLRDACVACMSSLEQ